MANRKSDGQWVMHTYEAGEIGEKIKFFVHGGRTTEKITRREKNEMKKGKQNAYSATKTLARLLNANFRKGGVLLGLDYSENAWMDLYAYAKEQFTKGKGSDPDSELEQERLDAIWQAASHALECCMRRVKRALKAEGIELKWCAITSDMDGDTGEVVRVHHHLVINEEAVGAFQKKWENLGNVEFDSMWTNQKDRTPIAEYFIRQVRRIPDAKKYRSSRNLIRPQPVKRICTEAEISVPKGCRLIHRSEYGPGQPQYIRYEIPERLIRDREERIATAGACIDFAMTLGEGGDPVE